MRSPTESIYFSVPFFTKRTPMFPRKSESMTPAATPIHLFLSRPDLGPSKLIPRLGHTGAWAKQPSRFEYELPKSPMRFGSLRFSGVLEPRGRQVRSGRQNWQNRPSWATEQGSQSGQSRGAKSQYTGLKPPLVAAHLGLACCHTGSVLFSKARVKRWETKKQNMQNCKKWLSLYVLYSQSCQGSKYQEIG